MMLCDEGSTDGRLLVSVEGVFRKPVYERGLPDCRVTQENQFKTSVFHYVEF
jgi:hypothetical protein